MIQSLQRDDVPHWANERDGRVVDSRNSLLVLSPMSGKDARAHFVDVAWGRGRRGLVPSTKLEILRAKIGKFPVTLFTSITGLLERAA